MKKMMKFGMRRKKMSEYLKCENCGTVIELSDDASNLVDNLVFDVDVEKTPATIVEEVVKNVFNPCCKNPKYGFVHGDYCKINESDILEYIWSESKNRSEEGSDGN